MASITETRIATVIARDGVDTRNKENCSNSAEHATGDNLSVDAITVLGKPAVEQGCLSNGLCECGVIAWEYVNDVPLCWTCNDIRKETCCEGCGITHDVRSVETGKGTQNMCAPCFYKQEDDVHETHSFGPHKFNKYGRLVVDEGYLRAIDRAFGW